MQLQSKNYLRRRGTILTAQGLRKLNQAKAEVEIEQNFKRYTLEALSEVTGLTPNTLSKIFTRSVGVDKRTLQCCFDAFNLILLKDDYLYMEPHQDNLAEIGSTSLAEACCPIQPICDSALETLCVGVARRRHRSNTPQIYKMERLQDNLQPRPLTPPGGQMPLDSVFYIDRPILESLCYEAIQQSGVSINIRAPKHMGKTSLMTRILAYSKNLGYKTVSVSLQLANDEILQNLECFLQWFCARVSKQLDVPNTIANFWTDSLGSKSNATDYFEDVILANLDRPLVIAIDELNQLLAYPDITREFLLLLRTWSEQAKARVADSNPWHNLRLVMVHSTEIQMSVAINQSLLNTGLVIELPEFTPDQVQELARRWGEEMTAQQIKNVIALLGGHPYRLQLAFYYLHQQTITLEQLLENSAIATAIYADHLEQQWSNLQRYPDLWPSFTEILQQSSLVDCEAVQTSQLHKMGLVHLHGLQTSLACELFRPFFCARLPKSFP
ncbi:AAA-like domain-containing protein [Nostoc sp. CALU 1950]|uniref:AAA-like domain-containing protein n=1 Tax=Nostoc sp. CALU 1950 TaxID=3104321 RepID=UPI003EB98205